MTGDPAAAQLSQLARRWGLVDLAPVAADYSQLWFARRGDQKVVLKLGHPESRDSEAAALAGWRSVDPGGPVVALLDHDLATGAVLLEHVLPGQTLIGLSERDDDAATRVAADLFAHLATHSPRSQPSRVPELAEIGRCFPTYWATGRGRMDERLVTSAQAAFAELVADPVAPVLLHGDLHHGNILRGQGRWRIIDPHGWWGDPSAEVWPFLRNPLDRDTAPLQSRRLAIVSEATGWDLERLATWAWVGATISRLWDLEDEPAGA